MTGLAGAGFPGAWLGELGGALVRVSVEGALWVALALLLVRAVPALPARLRCALWWAVSLKLVAGLVLALAWPAPLELPLLPPAGAGAAAESTTLASVPAPGATPGAMAAESMPATTAGGRTSSPAVGATGGEPRGVAGAAAPVGASPLPANSGAVLSGAVLSGAVLSGAVLTTAAAVAGAVWLLALLALGAAGARRHLHRRRERRDLEPVTDPGTLALLRRLARRFGVDPPPLATSRRVGTPQLVGWLRPRLLLPEALAATGPAARDGGRGRGSDLELALAHELAHLRRRDLAWGVVPWAARLAFFFHPLAPLALREYLLAREAACDAEVLQTLDASPRAYGRLLLTWGVARPGESAVAATLGHPRQLKRRLTMLQTATPKTGRRRLLTRYLPLAAALPILLALLPVRLVAAPDPETAAGTSEPTAATVRTADAPTTPARAATPAVRTTTVVGGGGHSAAGHGTVVAASGSSGSSGSSAMVVADDDSDAGGGSSYAYSWGDGDGDGEPMIYLQGENRSVGISTSSGQWDRVRELQRGDEALLWFVRDGQEYVVRDPALLAEVERAYRPVMELGKKQGALGADQGELGAEQGELGARQGRLGAEQGELAGKQAVLAAELARLAADRAARELDGDGLSDAERQRIKERTREVRAEMDALSRSIGALGDRQRALGVQQGKLGDRQRALGERQRELGERQREASEKARATVDDIIDRALAAGNAEAVD